MSNRFARTTILVVVALLLVVIGSAVPAIGSTANPDCHVPTGWIDHGKRGPLGQVLYDSPIQPGVSSFCAMRPIVIAPPNNLIHGPCDAIVLPGPDHDAGVAKLAEDTKRWGVDCNDPKYAKPQLPEIPTEAPRRAPR